MEHPIREQPFNGTLPPAIHLIGETTVPKELYTYLPFDWVKEVLNKKELVFEYPGLWDEPLEKIYLETDYSSLDFRQTKIYCMCFIDGDENEGTEWKMYASNYRKTIRCQINTMPLMETLAAFADKNNLLVYVGMVNYEYSKDEIQTLHLIKGKHYDRYFKDFSLENYLGLMLLKPKVLHWQNELRIFMVPKSDKQYLRDTLKVPILEEQHPLLFSKFTIQPFELKPSTIPGSMEFDRVGQEFEKSALAEKIQSLYPNAITENYMEYKKCRPVRKVVKRTGKNKLK